MHSVAANVENRKEDVAEQSSPEPVNGIDFVEVYTENNDTFRIQLLNLMFVNPITSPLLSLQSDQVSITGGERIPIVDVLWVEPWKTFKDLSDQISSSSFPSSPTVHVTADDKGAIKNRWEQNWQHESFQEALQAKKSTVESFLSAGGERSEDEQNRGLLIGTAGQVDFSLYELSLTESEHSEDAPEKVDPLLSQIQVNFKIACEQKLDCHPPEQEDQEDVPAPQINYLAKDFDSFRQLMLERLSTLMPDWQDRTPADLGVTLVELLAYAADQLSYYQDAVATESYLDTARKRISVRRHARLLDYNMHEGCNARTWVNLEVDGQDTILEPSYNEGLGGRTENLLFFTNMLGVPKHISPEQKQTLFREHDPEVFELVGPVYVNSTHNQIQIHNWGDPNFTLSEGTTRAALRDPSSDRLRLQPGDVLIFEQVQDPEMAEGVGNPDRRHAVRLTGVTPEAPLEDDDLSDDKIRNVPDRSSNDLRRDPVEDVPIVEVEWSEADALPFDLDVTAEVDGNYRTNLAVARGNVALVDHGRTIFEEELPEIRNRPYKPVVDKAPLTYAASPPGQQQSAREALHSEPTNATPQIFVRSFGTSAYDWEPRTDLMNSGSQARHFVVEMDEQQHAHLRFGDGEQGRQPVAHRRTTATYRVGNGSDGNIPADAIRHMYVPEEVPINLLNVRNPLPAKGGTDPESMDRVRRLAPEAYKDQLRAVTDADYAEWTEEHPDVQRARAERRWTGSWYTLFIAVDPVDKHTLDRTFENELRTHLETYRLAGDDIEIIEPYYVPLDLKMHICVRPGSDHSRIHRQLMRKFSNREHSDGKGFFHPDRWSFGESVYESDLIAEAMSVNGVADATFEPEGATFERLYEPSNLATEGTSTQTTGGEQTALEKGEIELSDPEIIRIENNPNFPERGTIEFILEGTG